MTLLFGVCFFKSESSLVLLITCPSPDFGVNVDKLYFLLGGGVGVVTDVLLSELVDEALKGVLGEATLGVVFGVADTEVTELDTGLGDNVGEGDPDLVWLDISVPGGDSDDANSWGGEDLGSGGASGAFFLLDLSCCDNFMVGVVLVVLSLSNTLERAFSGPAFCLRLCNNKRQSEQLCNICFP